MLAIAAILLSSAGTVQAQTQSPAIITSDYTPATLTRLNRVPIPGAGVLVADVNIHVNATAQFNTLTALGQYCRDSFLYRVTGMGDLIAHPFSCQGDIMTFSGTGGNSSDTEDFAVAVFPSASAAQAAPLSIIYNLDTQALPNQFHP